MTRLVFVTVLLRWSSIVWTRRFLHSLMALSQLVTKSWSSLSMIIGLMSICSRVGVRRLVIVLERASWWLAALSWMSMSSRYFCLKESFSFSTSVSRSQSLLEDCLWLSDLVGWPINWVRKSSWSKSSSSLVWGVTLWLLLLLLCSVASEAGSSRRSVGISSWLAISLTLSLSCLRYS